jgi:acid phosphatase
MNEIVGDCGTATQYLDNIFSDDLVSCPHYVALTSGSNCDTGLDQTGTGCITDDNDPTSHTLSTTSIFSQVTSWKAYIESMPGDCAAGSTGEYATKHNPPPYYTSLASCSTYDIPIAAATCSSSAKKTACGTPSNQLTQDLANDMLPQFAWITPNLLNDMHDGTVTQGDNWMYTYLPLILASPAYLRGEVVVYVLWDEQGTFTGGATPNFFVSPYITKGTSSSTTMNHFAALLSWENALGISTHLGCASGTIPGAGTCPTGSTADVRAAIGF